MNKNSEIMCHLLIKIELPLAPLCGELRFVFIRTIRGKEIISPTNDTNLHKSYTRYACAAIRMAP